MTNHASPGGPQPVNAGFGGKKAAPFKGGGGRKKSSPNNYKGQKRKSKGGK